MLSIRMLDERIPTIIVEGEVQVSSKNEIDEAIRLALPVGETELILDLTGVTSLDAGEAQAIIEATHRTLGGGGRLALVVSEKDKDNALKEARVADVPGVLIFTDRRKAMQYLGERGRGIA